MGLLVTALQTYKLRNKAEEERERVRVNYFVNQLSQVDQHANRKDFQKALGALRGIEPDTITEQRLLTTRLIGSMSETFYPRRVAEHYKQSALYFPMAALSRRTGVMSALELIMITKGQNLVDLEGHPEFHYSAMVRFSGPITMMWQSIMVWDTNFRGITLPRSFGFQGNKFPTDILLDDALR